MLVIGRLIEPDFLRLLDLNDPTVVNDNLNQSKSQRIDLLAHRFDPVFRSLVCLLPIRLFGRSHFNYGLRLKLIYIMSIEYL